MDIVVKDFNSTGCICNLLDDDKVKISLPDMLEGVLDVSRLQVVCLGDPNMYGEYAPYRFISGLGDFIKEALNM